MDMLPALIVSGIIVAVITCLMTAVLIKES
ncbi:hypothetical protein DFP78_11727 [Photobacterium lutimaris]|nr:hypothetical protein DFP78_11727 [Photobacterium lutimaris]